MQQPFDFDLLCRLAQEDPAAFEVQRRDLFEGALAQMPPQRETAARATLAHVQVMMAGARDPAERLLIAVSAMSESLSDLQYAFVTLCGEIAPAARGVRQPAVHRAA